MGFLGGIGNIVSKVLPKVVSVVSNIASSPAGQVGLDILKQLAQSAFSKDGKGGVFSDNVSVTLPNPLSRLNGLLGNIGRGINSISDFLSNIGNFLQGNRQLENGQGVNLPQLGERAETSSTAAASTANAIASGQYNTTIAQTAAASTSAPSTSGGSIIGSIRGEAFNTGITPDQQNLLSKVKDPTQRAQMEAQFQMQNYQNLMQFISNIMRIMGDVSKSIVSNIR